MNNIAVIYKSKYGATKKYGEWIAEELKADLFEKDQVKISQLENYHTIIYGGGLYAGGIGGSSFITKNFDKIKDKNLIVFTCGLADPKDESNIEGIHKGINKIFTTDMKEKITFFHFRGGMDYKNLNYLHKSMMAMMKRIISKKAPEALREEDKQFLETYGKKVDFTDKTAISPLIDFVKNTLPTFNDN